MEGVLHAAKLRFGKLRRATAFDALSLLPLLTHKRRRRRIVDNSQTLSNSANAVFR